MRAFRAQRDATVAALLANALTRPTHAPLRSPHRAATRQLAWVRGDSPERPRKNASDDDDVRLRCRVLDALARAAACLAERTAQDYAPSGAAAKRRKAGEAKPGA